MLRDRAARRGRIHQGGFSIHPRYGAKITIKSIRGPRTGEYEHDELAEARPSRSRAARGGPARADRDDPEAAAAASCSTALRPGSQRWARFRVAPAAKYYHQAYRHGLLDHTRLGRPGGQRRRGRLPGVDRDVAVTGRCFTTSARPRPTTTIPLAIDLTDAGRLLGEIPLGYYLVRREIESIEGFEPELAQAVLHIILSHHGSYENGSPVVPATREATLVHAIDNLGGKLGSFDRIERELPDGETWSRFDRGIDSAAYFGSRAAWSSAG